MEQLWEAADARSSSRADSGSLGCAQGFLWYASRAQVVCLGLRGSGLTWMAGEFRVEGVACVQKLLLPQML